MCVCVGGGVVGEGETQRGDREKKNTCLPGTIFSAILQLHASNYFVDQRPYFIKQGE